MGLTILVYWHFLADMCCFSHAAFRYRKRIDCRLASSVHLRILLLVLVIGFYVENHSDMILFLKLEGPFDFNKTVLMPKKFYQVTF